jgi:tetratricopeptide (TPR) repeat protein/predicted Ser/Thr protein kinase
MSCLDDNTAAAFVQGLATPEAAARVEAHLESCATCRDLIVAFGRAFGSASGGLDTEGDSGPRPLPALQRGERLDRYVVLERVGTGAMSVVYAAYDPELDRKVALKVMRATSGHDRLLIEARAIAKLSHPNVVSVFDARVLEGDLFLAMELVQGPTLRQWLVDQRGGWRPALALCLQAARGLAAAHRAGIVHRDFKPENVLIGPDGFVKVVDFGLAMRARDEVSSVDAPDAQASASWPLGITRTGSVVGTPLYMAPELMDGGVASTSSDQFALCVVLHEALLGRRPFGATDFAGLRREKREGLPPIAERNGVPRGYVDAIRRGLAPHPEDRWPSIDALLARLTQARTRAPTIAAGVVGLGLVGALAVRSAGADPQPCTGGSDAIATTWDAARRQAVDTRMRASDVATDVAREHALGRIDAWSEAWVEGWTRACRATHVDGVQTAELLDRRLACLDRGRAGMFALVELLARGEPDAVARAGEAVDELRDVATCDDTEALLRRAPEPPDSELARATAARIAEARAHRVAGRYADAVALAGAALESAADVGDRALRSRARLEHAHALAAAAEANAAEDAFVQAIAEASAVGADDVVAEAWVGLLAVVGRAARYDEAERVGRFADAALERVDDPAPLRRKWWLALGAVALARGEHDLAAERYAAAHALAIDDSLTDTLEQLARVELARGRVDAALAHMDRVLELRTAELGEHHPRVADALVNYGNVLHDAGRWDEAAERYDAAAADLERALGPTHPSLAGALAGRAVVERRRGDLAGSRRDLERALAIREAAFGTEHPEVAHTLVSLANVDYELTDYPQARARLDRALTIYAVHFDGDHPRVVAALANLASVDTDAGRLPEAELGYRRVLAAREAMLGDDHPEVAFTLANLGRVVAQRGRPDEAKSLLERAIAIATAKLGERHPFLAFARESLDEVDLEAARR